MFFKIVIPKREITLYPLPDALAQQFEYQYIVGERSGVLYLLASGNTSILDMHCYRKYFDYSKLIPSTQLIFPMVQNSIKYVIPRLVCPLLLRPVCLAWTIGTHIFREFRKIRKLIFLSNRSDVPLFVTLLSNFSVAFVDSNMRVDYIAATLEPQWG